MSVALPRRDDAKQPLLHESAHRKDAKRNPTSQIDGAEEDSWSNWVTVGLLVATTACVAATIWIASDLKLPTYNWEFMKEASGLVLGSGELASSSYCSGHGIQTTTNVCVCDLGYSGHSCQTVVEIQSSAYAEIVRTVSRGVGQEGGMDVTVLYIGQEDNTEQDVWRAGFYTMKAQKQGLVCFSSKFVVHVDSPGEQTLRRLAAAGSPPRDVEVEMLKADFMGQKMVEMADSVLTSFDATISDLAQQKWQLPESIYSIPFIHSSSGGGDASLGLHRRSLAPINVDEITFVGSLSDVHGLQRVCDAIDILDNSLGDVQSFPRITFLGQIGKFGEMPADEYIESRSLSWNNIDWDVISGPRAVSDIVSYLSDAKDGSGPHRLAVLANPYDHSGFFYAELVRAGVPVVATRLPAYEATLDPELHSDMLFASETTDLVRIVRESITRGALTPIARIPLMDAVDTSNAWFDMFMRNAAAPVTCDSSSVVLSADAQNTDFDDADMDGPLISIVLVHRNRHQLLEQAIKSIEDQTFNNYEVVLVDDGSDDPDTLQYLQDLAWKWWEERGWRVLREPNRYLGAARNTGVKYAKGKYILFMDDDDYAKPHQLATLARVVANTKPDIVTAGHDLFEGYSSPPGQGLAQGRYLPLGSATTVGLLENVFGDSNMLVERNFFIDTGGFSETFGVGFEDYEFFAKAVLRGANLEALPESLHWYRRHPKAMSYNTDLKAGQVRYLKPYLEAERNVDLSTREARSLSAPTQTMAVDLVLRIDAAPNLSSQRTPLTVTSSALVSLDKTVFPVGIGQTLRATVKNLDIFSTPGDVNLLKCKFSFPATNFVNRTSAVIVSSNTLLCPVPVSLPYYAPGVYGWQFSIEYPTDDRIVTVQATAPMSINPYPGSLNISAGNTISKIRPVTPDVQGSFFIGGTCSIPLTFTAMDYSRFANGTNYPAYCVINNTVGGGMPMYSPAVPVNGTFGAYTCSINCSSSTQYRLQMTLDYNVTANTFSNLLAGSVVVNIYDSAPTVLSAVLSNSGASITFSFSKPIRISGYPTLPTSLTGSQIFDSSMKVLFCGDQGTLSDLVVRVLNSVTLVVDLPFSNTLSFSGDLPQVVFKPLSIFSAISNFDDYFGVSASASVSLPPSPPVPVAVISGPDAVSYCDSLTLTGLNSYNLAGRPGTYTWSVLPSHGDVVASLSSTATITLSKDILSAHKGQTYTFSITVKNWLQGSSTATKIVKISDKGIPSVRVIGGAVQNITSGDVLTLKATATLSMCQTNSSSALVFEWSYSPSSASFDQAFATMKNNPFIVVPFSSLSPTQIYTFSVLVYPTGQPDASATTAVTVRPVLGPVVVSLGARARTISASTAATFYATYQDLSALSLSSRVITWTASLVGAGTLFPLDQPAQSGTALTIKGGTFTAGTTIVLSVLADAKDGTGRSASASTTLTVVAEKVVSAYSFVTAPSYGATTILQSNSLQVRAFVDPASIVIGTPVSYSWSSIAGTASDNATPLTVLTLSNSTITDGVTSVARLNVAPGVLVPGGYYRFQCTVSQVGSSSTTTSVEVKVAGLPTSGTLSLTPSTGIKALKTIVTLSAPYWTVISSEQPLLYKFNIYVPHTSYGTPNVLPAVQISTDKDSSVDTILPISSTSNVLIELIVKSSITQASTTTTMVVSVVSDLADWTEFSSLNDAAVAAAQKAGSGMNRVIQIFATSMKEWKPSVSLPPSIAQAIVANTLNNVFASNVVSPDLSAERIATISALVDCVTLTSDQGSQIGSFLANDIARLESQQTSNPSFSISDSDLKSYYKAFSGVLTSYTNTTTSANQSETLISGIQAAQRLNLRSMACGQQGKSAAFGDLSTSIGKSDLSSSGTVDSGNGTSFGFGSGLSLSVGDHSVNCFCTQALNSPPYQFNYVGGMASLEINSTSNQITFSLPLSSSVTKGFNPRNQSFGPTTPEYPQTPSESSTNVGAIVGGVIGGAALVGIAAGSVYFVQKKRKEKDSKQKIPAPQSTTSKPPEMHQKPLDEMKNAAKPDSAGPADTIPVRAPPTLDAKVHTPTSENVNSDPPTSSSKPVERASQLSAPPEVPPEVDTTTSVAEPVASVPVAAFTYTPRFREREEIPGLPLIRFGPLYELPLEYADAMKMLGLRTG
ncbi:hypothetical protein HDU93_007113 [Gonapodya sp. JEL0774]|nr:hypothetical protein HDU93_007113 [Gonapodya sp. JEL0774]